tara:strand:+ start:448 stop:831 length:384 start_codon:yes stop_codon:yes gene_type:complete
MSYRKLSGLDYRDFARTGKKGIDAFKHNSRIRKPKRMWEVADNKEWTREERAFLYNIVEQGITHFGLVHKKFSDAGFKDLRPVHVEIAERHLSYGPAAKEGYINGKSDFTASKASRDAEIRRKIWRG